MLEGMFVRGYLSPPFRQINFIIQDQVIQEYCNYIESKKI